MIRFLDTYVLFAWVKPDEPYHTEAKIYLGQASQRYLTTEWILQEFADGMSAPRNRTLAVKIIEMLRVNPKIEIIPFDNAIYAEGFELYTARSDKYWSLTDCISFVVMTRRHVIEALTADHHFRQAGFIPVFLPDTRP